MKLTNKIYLAEPYKRELTAKIVAIEEWKEYQGIILDSTIFYPEGGGPKGDRGYIDATYVHNTIYKEDGTILHLVSTACCLEIGKEYRTVLDWPHRYHYMKHHTAQHLISGILFNSFSIDTLSVHLSEAYIAIETGTSFISPMEINLIEDKVNDAIRHGGLIHSIEVHKEDVHLLNLRRSVKVDGLVRIVTIEGYDKIACGGVHLENISEIEQVMFQSSELVRNHVRLFFLISDLARNEIRETLDVVDSLKTELSVSRDKIVEKIQGIQQEVVSLKREIHLYQQKIIDFIMYPYFEAEEIPIVMLDLSEYSFDALKIISNSIPSSQKIALCAIKQRDQESMNYLIYLKGIGDDQQLYNEIKSTILLSLDAKGGGKAPLWQGIAKLKPEVLIEIEHVCKRVIRG